MRDVLLFHHALGVTPGIETIADRLRAEGHRVTVPDLFEGEVFDDLDAGVAHAGRIGFDTITDRGVAVADRIDGDVFVIGFSLGVLPAQKLAQTRPGVRGAILCHGAIPLGEFADDWPADLAVQFHMIEHDPWSTEDLEAARQIADTALLGQLFIHPGTGHLVTDSSSPDYDPSVAKQIVELAVALVANPLEATSDGLRYYHGTRADLSVGDLIEPGFRSNFGSRREANNVYLTATVDAAVWGAELAVGDGAGRIYIVEPTGSVEDDPNLTDKRFPGNPTKSYRSRSPLRVMGELMNWKGHPPDVLQRMKDNLEHLKQLGVEAIDD